MCHTMCIMKRILLLLSLISLILVGCGDSAEMDHSGHDMSDSEMPMGNDAYADLDTSTNKMTDNETFHVSVTANVDPVPINELHTWTLTVMDQEMNPVSDAAISFGGGMPEHDHGFPTEPQVSPGAGDGEYLIEGVKMQMSGWWEMKLNIESGDMADTVTFNIVLP